MPDPDSSPQVFAVTPPLGYLTPELSATPSLEALLREKIVRDGPLSFADFMAIALYEPTFGYYAQEPRQVGRDGDFYTSVSVGNLFGQLLAQRFLREWENLGRPERWRIIECGAHDGTLAADIIQSLCRLSRPAGLALEYIISEPLPRLRATQESLLSPYDQVQWVDHIQELHERPLPGIAFGNELLDALPFHIVEWRHGKWHECRVGCKTAGFEWTATSPINDKELLEALSHLGTDFPASYRTEIRHNFQQFLTPLSSALSSGLLLWLDYGFARPEYYHPDRTQGTLRTFSKHRAAEDPLSSVGQIDITAHVDFTAVAEAAIRLGGIPTNFTNQGAWLTEVGRDFLLSLDGNPDPQALRQFQSLTHPAHLGAKFHVLEISWNQAAETIPPAVARRLAMRA